jgi:F-type H+-transporting ATPase subunit b
MKRRHMFILAAALVAFAPAVAHAVQHHAPDSAQHAAERSVSAATAHEESARSEEAPSHEQPKDINWFDISNHEQPAYGAMVLNFVLLIWMYVALGKKPIAEALKNRRASVAKEIEEAKRMRDEAEARAEKYQLKLKNLEGELKEARESLLAAGGADRDRIVREAEEKALRMAKDAAFMVEQESKQMSAELTRNAVEMAMAAAEEILKKRITPADQERLAEDYLAQIGGRKAGSETRASQFPAGGE